MNDDGFNPFQFTTLSTQLWFGGKKLAVRDRLGSKGGYYPFGEERGSAVQNDDSFATYYRDKTTGVDYADQRYYSGAIGRLVTPDPYRAGTGSGIPSNPQSWNRYAYVLNDPVNFLDPFGLDACTWNPATNTLNCTTDTGGGGIGDGGRGPGRPAGPIPNDPPPLTGLERNAVLDNLRRLVKEGVETDCKALADYLDAVAERLEGSKTGPKAIKVALAALTPNQFPVPFIPDVTGNNNYKALNDGSVASGFAAQFQDQIPTADQAHHFAAFFQLGFAYGADAAAKAAEWWEKLEGTPGNTGDINLGKTAALMGAYVVSGVLPIDQLGETIRSFLCK